MEKCHATLLIGGMSLKGLDCEIDGDADRESGHWIGRFSLERADVHCLQVGRPYRLELDDGRAAQVDISRMDTPVGHLRLLIEFDGTTPLTTSRWQRIPR